MTLDQRINSLDILGEIIRAFTGDTATRVVPKPWIKDALEHLTTAVHEAFTVNPWFTPEHIRFTLSHWGEMLQRKKLESWISRYPWKNDPEDHPKRVGLIMAGNIPMVGFHDLLCVLVSGHKAIVKLSSQDNRLIPALTDCLIRIDQEWKPRLEIAGAELQNPDIIIATGSNNSARYFTSYFRKYPHIIRKNRTGVAVLTGEENEQDLAGLASDVFLYFGLGCRNVSKIYIPKLFDVSILGPSFSRFNHFWDHTRYRHNLDFHKAICLVNRIRFIDGGFYLLVEDPGWVSPVSVLYYERYSDINYVQHRIDRERDQIQCVVTTREDWPERVLPGFTQKPSLSDYADQVDTLAFLLEKK